MAPCSSQAAQRKAPRDKVFLAALLVQEELVNAHVTLKASWAQLGILALSSGVQGCGFEAVGSSKHVGSRIAREQQGPTLTRTIH